jgi:hypothetical protein
MYIKTIRDANSLPNLNFKKENRLISTYCTTEMNVLYSTTIEAHGISTEAGNIRHSSLTAPWRTMLGY